MLIEQVCSGEVTPRTEVRLPHADGSLRTFEVIASAMAPSGEGRRAVLNARDITERRHAEDALRVREEQLRQAQKMEAVGRLAGGIAHDFSNVLTVITGACDRLQETIARGQADTRQIDVILRNCGRATALTRQLLAFSRQQTVAPQIVDVRALITGASDLLADLVGSHVQVDVHVEPDLSPIEIDPVQLEQVLMNLAINAGDAMPDGGHLRLIGRNVTVLQGGPTLLRPPVAPGEYVRLEVIDTGHGMTADTRSRAFEPFFTTKGPNRGTGLGLATVYGIVTQSRGHISIDSAPGKGTRFEMHFPARAGLVPPAVPLASAASQTESAHKATILVAEDDPDVRSLLCDTLIARGYTVVEAGGVGEATRAARQHAGSIDLLLTDLVMPGGSGRELARQIATSKPRLRVLYMSGFGDAGRQGSALLEPGDPFLAKPFTSRQLLDAVSALLG
jgi:signal transduction histidine kinase